MELAGIPLPVLNGIGVVTLWSVIGVLVLTRKLVWHTDLKECKAEAREWKELALRGLVVAETATVHSEVLIAKSPEVLP